MKFCKLEKDQKSFEYLKKFCQINFESEDGEDCIFKLDNMIQKIEMEEHCRRNGIHENVNQEYMLWVSTWGADFRVYLSTLKLLVFAAKLLNKNIQYITWEEFCELEDKINQLKPLLDTIF